MEWQSWFYAVAALLFLVAELAAALDGQPGSTLTENLRPFLRRYKVLHTALVFFLIWLFFHFAFV